MKIEIEYFAVLRDQAGRQMETVTGEGSTLAAIYEALRKKYNFTLDQAHLRVAVNDEFADWDRKLNAGDRIVFIPPVAGG